MKLKAFIICILSLLNTSTLFSQQKEHIRALFVHAESQFMNYDYLTVGLGYQPKKTMTTVVRKHPKYAFTGWTLNLSKKLENSDWGTSIQTILYSGTASGPFGFGLEANYKSINKTNHLGIKPLIGISFPIVSLMYAYNFDFYKIKSERINQHELILGLRMAVLREKK